jgi:hypothetical protein
MHFSTNSEKYAHYIKIHSFLREYENTASRQPKS